MGSRKLLETHVKFYSKSWIQEQLADLNRNAASDSIIANLKYVGATYALDYLVKKMSEKAAAALHPAVAPVVLGITLKGVAESISDGFSRSHLQSVLDKMDKDGGHVEVSTRIYQIGPPSKPRISTRTSVNFRIY